MKGKHPILLLLPQAERSEAEEAFVVGYGCVKLLKLLLKSYLKIFSSSFSFLSEK